MVQNNYVPKTISALLSSPIGIALKPDVIILESDSTVDEATKLMKERNSRTVFVSKIEEVMRILSKTDILFKVISQNTNTSKVRIRSRSSWNGVQR